MVVELESVMLLAMDVLRGPYVHCYAPMHDAAATQAAPSSSSSIAHNNTSNTTGADHVWRAAMGNEEACSSPDSPYYVSDAAFRAAYAALSSRSTASTHAATCGGNNTKKTAGMQQSNSAAASVVARVSRLTDMLVPRSEFCRRVLWLFEAESGVLYVYYPEEIVAERYQRKTLRYSLCLAFRLPPHVISIGETLVERLVLPYAAVLLNVAEELREAELKYGYVSDGLAATKSTKTSARQEGEHEGGAHDTCADTNASKTTEAEAHAVNEESAATAAAATAARVQHEDAQPALPIQTQGHTLNCFVTPCTSHTWHSLQTVVADLYKCLHSTDAAPTTVAAAATTTTSDASVGDDHTVLFLSDRFFIHVHRPPALRPMRLVHYDDIAVPLTRCTHDIVDGMDLAVARVFALVDGKRRVVELILSLVMNTPMTLAALPGLVGEEACLVHANTSYNEEATMATRRPASNTPWSRQPSPRFAIVPEREAEPRRWMLYLQSGTDTGTRCGTQESGQASKSQPHEEGRANAAAAAATSTRLSSSLGEKSASLVVHNASKTRGNAASQDNVMSGRPWYQGTGTNNTVQAAAAAAVATVTSSSTTLEPSSSNETQRALSRGSGGAAAAPLVAAAASAGGAGSAAIPTSTNTMPTTTTTTAKASLVNLTGSHGTGGSSATSHGHLPSSGQSASTAAAQGHSPAGKLRVDVAAAAASSPSSLSSSSAARPLLLFELPESWSHMTAIVCEALQHLEQAGMLRLVRPWRATAMYGGTRTLHAVLASPAHPAREDLGRYMLRVHRLVGQARTLRRQAAKSVGSSTMVRQPDTECSAAPAPSEAAGRGHEEGDDEEEQQLRQAITASLCALGKYTHCTLGAMRAAMRQVPALRHCFHGWCHECCRALTELAVLNDWLVEEQSTNASV